MFRLSRLLILALTAVAALAVTVSAELATQTEMREVAGNWSSEIVARTGDWAGTSQPTIVSEGEIRSDEGRLLARYFNFDPVGYVVVPVLKEMPPVKMYSDESNLGPEQEETVIQLLREVLESRMQAYESVYGDVSYAQPSDGLFDPIHKSEWNRLAVVSKEFRPETAVGVEVEGGPLLTSNWHQHEPFSDYCPMGDGDRCVVGCVATSASQIMDYWEWPLSGYGSFGYFWEGDNCNGGSVPGEYLTANFSDSYDWANMKDTYDTWTTAEADAAAELCSEVGIAMEMNYGACGSGTQMYVHAFSDYFKYNADIWREDRTDHTVASWFALIQQEVDAGRPIWYTINSHAIVADGYRDTYGDYEYHMNYGWGGSHTAWYVIDNLYCYWIEGDVCPWEQDYMFGNIHPQYDPVLSLAAYSLVEAPGGDGDNHLDGGETFYLDIEVHNLGNDADNVQAVVTNATGLITVTNGTTTFPGTIGWGGVAQGATSIEFTVNPDPPSPQIGEVEITIYDGAMNPTVRTILLAFGDVAGFEDQMEAGEGNWTHFANSKSFTDDWHLETSRAYSGAYSWKHGGPGFDNYSNSADGALYTEPFVVPYDGELSFYHWIEAEDDANQMAWDGAVVMITPPGVLGVAGDQLFPEEGYTYSVIDNSASPFDPYIGCYSGSQGWQQATFDLSSYANQLVQVVFRFGSDAYVSFEGWYVDDVSVTNTPVGSPVTMSPGPGAGLTFLEVTSAGITQMNVSGEGPELPGDLTTVPAVPEFYEFTTTADWTDAIEVCLQYDEADVTGDESDMRLFVYAVDQWIDITTGVDVEANTVCGSAPILSQYVMANVESGCCVGLVGNANGSYDEAPTIGDISIMIDAKFIAQTCDGLIACPAEADINRSATGEATCDDVTIGDISMLIDYLFIAGPETFGPLDPCP